MQKVVGWDCPLGATLSGKPSLDELTIWRSKALVVGGEAKWQCAILAQATSSLWDNQLSLSLAASNLARPSLIPSFGHWHLASAVMVA